ncbi:hypothetical protein [Chromobacterium sp. IIBBL 290-4]|uniref:hypothetical protein n=1 Tax=Chromobacterium sp. IIBBL 290-4 TaxID=2953890 RepID=UPI0020B842F9|nr:hypothetical protein [Chromobacterium sp. IIBBL 290-4]UTH76461.1 hypothetical protein NKT35_10300 [Chromobacterium sp. IIBBL 290-4]
MQRVLPGAQALTKHRLLQRTDSGFYLLRLWNSRGYGTDACHHAWLADLATS